MNEPMQLTCPNCQHKLDIVAAIEVPASQRMTFTIEHESRGLSLKTLHGVLSNLDKLLVAVAKQSGANVAVMVDSIKHGDNKMTVDMIIANNSKRLPSSA